MKNKKIISIVISILLVISLTSTVFIATANAKEVSITITTDKQELKSGETATVSVAVTSNFPVATMSIPVFYDKTLVDVESCATPLDYDCAISTTDKTAVDSAKIYANTGIESEKFGFVLATYIAGAGDSVAETLSNTIVLTFSVKAKADVNGNAVFKVIGESAKTEENVKGMLYFGAQPKGNVIDEIPENVENIDITSAMQTIKIGTALPELLLSEYGEEMGAVIDRNAYVEDYAGYVYGIDTVNFEVIEDYLTTPAGRIAVVENELGEFSTGAVIELYDDEDTLIESYVFVCFGDVTGDNLIDLDDSGAIEAHDAFIDELIEGTAQFKAADVSGDGMVDLDDSGAIEAQDAFIEDIPTQADIAAMHAEL